MVRSLEPGTVLLLAGPSTSDSNFLLRALSDDLAEEGRALVNLSIDDRYLMSGVGEAPDSGASLTPNLLNWNWVIEDVRRLFERGEVQIPSYNRATGLATRHSEDRVVLRGRNGDVLCIHSQFAFHPALMESLRRQNARIVMVFLDLPSEMRILRRARRRFILHQDMAVRTQILQETLQEWPRVLQVEEREVMQQAQAERVVMIDEYTPQEAAELRRVFEPLLRQIRDGEEGLLAKGITRFLVNATRPVLSVPEVVAMPVHELVASLDSQDKRCVILCEEEVRGAIEDSGVLEGWDSVVSHAVVSVERLIRDRDHFTSYIRQVREVHRCYRYYRIKFHD